MKYKQIIALSLLMTSAIHETYAELNPASYPTDERIKYVKYQENNVVSINGVPFTATQVVFGNDEVIIDKIGGDSAVWMVHQLENLNNMVFIKPTQLGSNSNMTIITNKHSYYFNLVSSKTLNETPNNRTYAIKFIYPEEEAARLKANALRSNQVINPLKNPERYNWSYRFSGSTQLTPPHVFDDGTFTYFELSKNEPAPAIFAVDDAQGKESVVNTRRQGNYLVVQRTAPQFTLRHGGLVASVFNANEINRIKLGRREA